MKLRRHRAETTIKSRKPSRGGRPKGGNGGGAPAESRKVARLTKVPGSREQPELEGAVVTKPANGELWPRNHGEDLPASVAADSTEMSPLQLYLREIGQVALLTPKEEISLGKRIQKGDEAAREHMIKANLRLVVKIARDYENLGLPLLDLIN